MLLSQLFVRSIIQRFFLIVSFKRRREMPKDPTDSLLNLLTK